MGKKSKQYWFNALIYELSKAEPIDGELKNLDEHLADWLKRSHDMLTSPPKTVPSKPSPTATPTATPASQNSANTPAPKSEKHSATNTPPNTEPVDSTTSSTNELKTS